MFYKPTICSLQRLEQTYAFASAEPALFTRALAVHAVAFPRLHGMQLMAWQREEALETKSSFGDFGSSVFFSCNFFFTGPDENVSLGFDTFLQACNRYNVKIREEPD